MSDEMHRLDDEYTAADYADLAEHAHLVENIDLDALTFSSAPDPIELPPPSSDAMVVRALRVPLDLEMRLKAIAGARDVPVTALMREFITDGVEAAENVAGTQRDPVTELHRIADAATRALHALDPTRHAA